MIAGCCYKFVVLGAPSNDGAPSQGVLQYKDPGVLVLSLFRTHYLL